KDDAGLTCPVEIRVNPNAEDEPAEGEAEAAGDAAAAPPPPPPPDPGVVKRFNAMAAGIKTALLQQVPDMARIPSLAASVAGLLKNKDFAQAAKVLDELEPLVPGVAAEKPAAQKPPTEQSPTEAKGKLVVLQQSRLAWEAARKRAGAELAKVKKGLV